MKFCAVTGARSSYNSILIMPLLVSSVAVRFAMIWEILLCKNAGAGYCASARNSGKRTIEFLQNRVKTKAGFAYRLSLLRLSAMPRRGFEPPRPCEHWHLKPACLPFHHLGGRVQAAHYLSCAVLVAKLYGLWYNLSRRTKEKFQYRPEFARICRFAGENACDFDRNA